MKEHKEIIDYYKYSQIDYELVWHLKTHQSMHYGIWKDGIRNLREALLCTNHLIIETLEINESKAVIDLGCGIGGSSIYIASRTGCKVHGVSISPFQIEQAIKLSTNRNISHKCTFTCQDYTKTSFKANSFDAGFAIESSCYAQDLELFVREISRILKPNGEIVVLDFFWSRPPDTARERNLMSKWVRSWAINDFKPEKEIEELFNKNGFQIQKKVNLNKEIKPSINRLLIYFFPGIICHSMLFLIGLRNRIQGRNMYSTLYQYILFKKKLWNYNLYHARKL